MRLQGSTGRGRRATWCRAAIAFLLVLMGIAILMGWTVTLGLAIGFGVTVLAGIKFPTFGFGLSGAVLGRRVDTSTE